MPDDGEIIVRGTRPRPPPWWPPGVPYVPVNIDPRTGPPPGALAGLPALALPVTTPPPPPTPVPRPTLTLVPKPAPAIPEIIVKAKRITGLHAAFASILGMLGAAIARDLSQQALDESFRAFQAPDAFVPRDTPLAVQLPEEIPVVEVRASIAEQLRAQLEIPPLPTFWPYAPTPISIPTRAPATIPLSPPATVPDLAPIPAPAPVGRPVAPPLTLPQPGTPLNPFPIATPLPRTRSRPAPTPGTRLTTGPRPGVGLLELPTPQPVPKTNPARRRCPKRKKCKEDKDRKKCYRALVKQARKPKDDEYFNWVQIDCDTGKELKKRPQLRVVK